jgi:glycosyltransferase involved in cell wall biosynthesis
LLEACGHQVEPFEATTAQHFVWKHRRDPYDLTVYQLGNAACHDYMWGYLFRYPGLVVLHDAQLHQARALNLTKRWEPRRDDYIAEFRANHPDAPPGIAEVVAAGFGGSLYQHWPLIRLVVERARQVLVHNRRLAHALRATYPIASVAAIEMGVADPLHMCGQGSGGAHAHLATSARLVRLRHGIPPDAIVLAAYGGITPEKRVGAVIRALSALAERHPLLHLMLVGSEAAHYDVRDEARRWGIADRVHVTGYVADADLPGYLAAADICACLRWPTNRETSASWLRCLAAGKPTIITALWHLGDVPTYDPRDWRVLDTASTPREPAAVGIDILDERHSLQRALDRLGTDSALRARLGEAARRWWEAHHQLDAMAQAYNAILASAAQSAPGAIDLPPHLTADGTRHGRALASALGVSDKLIDILPG